MQNKRKISDFRQYEQSPFKLYGLEKRVITKRSKSATMVSTDGGEITFTEPGEQKAILHDEEQYLKLFKYGIATMKNLNARAMCLLLYVMHELVPRKNTVEITRAKVELFSPKLSGASYYIAMTELLDLGLIARSKGSKKVFYVNPNMVFNGDRRGLFNTNNKEEKA